jgi:hypothetical protein
MKLDNRIDKGLNHACSQHRLRAAKGSDLRGEDLLFFVH